MTAPKARRPINLGEDCLRPTEFVLDGFMPAAVSVVAGAWGAGKSTCLIPLLASVAHLAPDSWGFRPDIRRHVIWMTEAPEQARDTLWSLCKAEGAADWDEFKLWFYLFAARRNDAQDLARELKDLVEQCTWPTETGFEVKPVIVLDTTTANINLESENDNAQVGMAMAAFKQLLPGTPLILIGHTPKAMRRASDPADMTFRGAGAWEAEAAATYVLGWDEETGKRFLAIRKARFTPTYTEVDFGQEGGSIILDTPWGQPQSKAYLHGVPSKSNGEARRAARREAQERQSEERKARAETDRQGRVLGAIRAFAAEGRLVTRKALHDELGGDKTRFYAALKALLDAGLAREHELTHEQLGRMGLERTNPAPKLILPAEVELHAFSRAMTEYQR